MYRTVITTHIRRNVCMNRLLEQNLFVSWGDIQIHSFSCENDPLKKALWVLTPVGMRDAPGEAGVCGLEGGVIGLLWKRKPLELSFSCREVAGDPSIGCCCWDINTSISMPMGEGGLSSSVEERCRPWLAVIFSSTNMLRKLCTRNVKKTKWQSWLNI